MQLKFLTSCNSIGRSPDGFPSLLIDEMGGIRIQGVLWRPRVSAASSKVAWDHRGISR